jgi:hypothetical protein
VRVNQREPVIEFQVLKGHRLNECRFAGAGLADDVHMREAILIFYAKRPAIPPKIDSP